MSRARKPAALTLAFALVLALLTGIQVSVPLPAHAAPVTDFEPGNIISDSIMYDASTMNASTVQSFLEARGAACVAAAGSTCIKNYRESTPSRAATAMCPGAYAGTSDERAADIIAKVSVACGINPQVLLVTLQKEQGLITSTAGKTPYTYSRALGFGCPDNVGGWCNPAYAGFANQVYSAANQLKRYAAGLAGSYRPGRVNTILWNPNAACGSSQVYIENQATASLYSYTPYRPNAAALAAGFGSGDSCSSYGNRNFHLYFTAWFGSAKQRLPIGLIDVVQSVGTGTVQVAGWTFDPDTSASLDVHFYVDGVGVLAAKADRSRPDVGTLYNRGPAAGFDVRLPTSAGRHDVCAYAIDGNGGTNVLLGCRSVTVVNAPPLGVFDDARAAGPGVVQLIGWTFDPDTTAPIDVHVYVDGVGVLATKANGERPDVEAIYKKGPLHGYDIRVPVASGNHTVCLYAIDSSGGTNVLLGCKTVQASNKPPVGLIDVIQSPAPGKVQVRGWAFDPDTSASIAMHVYVDGAFAGSLDANTSRPDVGALYNRGPNHGYDSVIPVSAGTRSVCVYAIDSTGGVNPFVGCRTVTVANTPPQGALESSTGTGAAIGGAKATANVSGWAWDFDVATPVTVRVLVDGVLAGTTTANRARAAIPGVGRTNVAFSAAVPAVPGTHRVCAEAVDPATGVGATVGCVEQVVIPNTGPVGVLDAPRAPAATSVHPSAINAVGWIQDFDTADPIYVHFYIDGQQVIPAGGTVAGTLAGNSRPDVAAIYGNGAQHGFDVMLPAAPGVRQLCSYAINYPKGQNIMVGPTCVTVTVP